MIELKKISGKFWATREYNVYREEWSIFMENDKAVFLVDLGIYSYFFLASNAAFLFGGQVEKKESITTG